MPPDSDGMLARLHGSFRTRPGSCPVR